MPEERDFTRGDLVETMAEVTGRVIGWIDDVTLCIQDVKDENNIVSSWYEQTSLLIKVEDLLNLDSLPKEIKLYDTRPKQ